MLQIPRARRFVRGGCLIFQAWLDSGHITITECRSRSCAWSSLTANTIPRFRERSGSTQRELCAIHSAAVACKRVLSTDAWACLGAPPLTHAVGSFHHRALHKAPKSLRRRCRSFCTFCGYTTLRRRHCYCPSSRKFLTVSLGRGRMRGQ